LGPIRFRLTGPAVLAISGRIGCCLDRLGGPQEEIDRKRRKGAARPLSDAVLRSGLDGEAFLPGAVSAATEGPGRAGGVEIGQRLRQFAEGWGVEEVVGDFATGEVPVEESDGALGVLNGLDDDGLVVSCSGNDPEVLGLVG
jgi:hypothetical protein